VIRLEPHRCAERGGGRLALYLTTSEGRTLARQLVHLADLEELHCDEH
jgi:hypothetical protein